MTSSVTMLPSSSRTIWYGEDRPSKLFTATTWQSRSTLMHQNESNDTYDFSVGTLSIWKFSLCTSLTLFISWLKTLHVLSGDLLNYQILSWLISMFCQLYVRYLCHITEECNNNVYNTSKHTFLCKLFKCLSRHHVLLTLDSAHSEYHGSATRKTLRDMANHWPQSSTNNKVPQNNEKHYKQVQNLHTIRTFTCSSTLPVVQIYIKWV